MQWGLLVHKEYRETKVCRANPALLAQQVQWALLVLLVLLAP